MKKEAIRERLTALCADVFQNSEIDVDLVEHADFFDDLGMDSITFITLIVEIEVAFDITIPDDLLIMNYFKNVGVIAQIIADRLAEKTQETEEKSNNEA